MNLFRCFLGHQQAIMPVHATLRGTRSEDEKRRLGSSFGSNTSPTPVQLCPIRLTRNTKHLNRPRMLLMTLVHLFRRLLMLRSSQTTHSSEIMA